MDMPSPPKVWRDYDQTELDRQYDQRSVVPDGDDYKAGDARASEKAREEIECRLDIAYGESKDERLDVFPAQAPGSPVLVFLHGGAWTRGDKSNESFIAPPLVAAGAAVICVNFTLAPDASLDEIVAQCRRAVAWTHAHAADINGDADRIVIAGHSSGAHQAAMMLITDWAGSGLPGNVLKGCVLTSGMYDLTPVRLTYRNEYLNLDDDAVERQSPIRHLTDGLPPVSVFYGGLELAEFRRQNREFADALDAAGISCTTQDLPGLNHFEMGRQLADTDSPVHQSALRLLGLG